MKLRTLGLAAALASPSSTHAGTEEAVPQCESTELATNYAQWMAEVLDDGGFGAAVRRENGSVQVHVGRVTLAELRYHETDIRLVQGTQNAWFGGVYDQMTHNTGRWTLEYCDPGPDGKGCDQGKPREVITAKDSTYADPNHRLGEIEFSQGITAGCDVSELQGALTS